MEFQLLLVCVCCLCARVASAREITVDCFRILERAKRAKDPFKGTLDFMVFAHAKNLELNFEPNFTKIKKTRTKNYF